MIRPSLESEASSCRARRPRTPGFCDGRLPDSRCRSSAERSRAAPVAGGPYIDVHTHVGRDLEPDPPLPPTRWSRWMDEHHVAKAVVLPLVSPESSSYLNLTEQAIEAARRFPDRLIPFCCIDPRTSYRGGRAGLRAMLKEYVDQGAKGFGEHKAGLPIDHPKMRALYEVCDDLRLPVLFHMDEQRGMDDARIARSGKRPQDVPERSRSSATGPASGRRSPAT